METPTSLVLMPYSSRAGTMMDMESGGGLQQVQGGSLEEQYAAILGHVMQSGDAKAGVQALENMCCARATQLRAEVQQSVHRPARYMNLQRLAQEFEAQAATWHLLVCLYCSQQSHVGAGGCLVPGAGGRRTARQIMADKVSVNPLLKRCASVVSWLESLADDALSGQGEGLQPRFAQHEGVWLVTHTRRGQAGIITEVDPDAPAREGAALHPDNAAAEERLLQRCWQLIRAGKHVEALALCRACGQEWRAASLGGPTGGWGPLPVGVAADNVDDDMKAEAQAEELACEVEMGGPAAPRALWKWACLQVALQAAARATPGGKYESAIYGVLAGHLPSVLPMCSTWRDQCWAYCRTWLDQAADAELASEHAQSHLQAAALAALASDDVLVDVVCKFKFGGGPDKGKAAVQGAMAAADGQPPSSIAQGLAGAAGPQSFSAVFTALKGSRVQAVAAAANDPLHQVQQLLIEDAMSGLTQHLHTWLLTDSNEANMADEGETVLGLPPQSTRMKAFGCHLLLMLEALGVLYGAPHSTEGILQMTRISGLAEQVVVLYTAALMERGNYELVPQYLCHLRAHARETLAQQALTTLTEQLVAAAAEDAAPDMQALNMYGGMSRWFKHCVQLQAQQHQLLRTSIGQQEARELIGRFLEGVRLRTLTLPSGDLAHPPQPNLGSPAAALLAASAGVALAPAAVLGSEAVGCSAWSRVCAARWLFYPYLHARGEQHETQLALDEWIWSEPLEHCVALLADLALGDNTCEQAALHLLTHVIPPGLLDATQVHVDGLQQHATTLRASAALLGGTGQPGITMVMDGAGSQREAMLGEAAAAEQKAGELAGLLHELGYWQTYFGFTSEAAAWLQSYEAFQEARAAPGAEAQKQQLREAGAQLLQAMQEQLLSPGWMSGLPLFIVPEGRPPVILVVTEQQQGPAGGQQGGETAAYPVLKGAALAGLQQQLLGAVRSAMVHLTPATARGPTGSTSSSRLGVVGTTPPSAEGHLTISLTCDWQNAQAVTDVVNIARSIVQGSLAGAPKVLVVNLCAPPAITTAVCVACCISKVASLCARLRLAMIALGGNGDDGAELVALLATGHPTAAAGAEGQTLSDMLSTQQLAEVLQLEAEAAVQVLSNQQLAAGAGHT